MYICGVLPAGTLCESLSPRSSILQLWSALPWTKDVEASLGSSPQKNAQFDPVAATSRSGGWKCTVCSLEFFNKERLKGHMKGHFGQLNHKCCICDKAFWKFEDLEGHMASTHTYAKRFHCSLCGNSFSYKRSLRRHLKQTHKTDWRDMATS